MEYSKEWIEKCIADAITHVENYNKHCRNIVIDLLKSKNSNYVPPVEMVTIDSEKLILYIDGCVALDGSEYCFDTLDFVEMIFEKFQIVLPSSTYSSWG